MPLAMPADENRRVCGQRHCHHAVGNVAAHKLYDFRQQAESTDESHDGAADENHGAAFGAVLTGGTGIGDGFGLKGDGGYTLSQCVAQGADEKGHGSGDGGKAEGQCQKPLWKAVQDDADDGKDVCENRTHEDTFSLCICGPHTKRPDGDIIVSLGRMSM